MQRKHMSLLPGVNILNTVCIIQVCWQQKKTIIITDTNIFILPGTTLNILTSMTPFYLLLLHVLGE